MALTEISASSELDFYLQASPTALLTFSAHWCVNCQKTKPQLEAMAESYANDEDISFAYIPDADMGDFSEVYQISGFPTYVLFVEGAEVGRGANLEAVKALIQQHHKPSAS